MNPTPTRGGKMTRALLFGLVVLVSQVSWTEAARVEQAGGLDGNKLQEAPCLISKTTGTCIGFGRTSGEAVELINSEPNRVGATPSNANVRSLLRFKRAATVKSKICHSENFFFDDNPKYATSQGSPKIVSSYLESVGGGSVTFSVDVPHTTKLDFSPFGWKGLLANVIFDQINSILPKNMTREANKISSFSYGLTMGPKSKGRVQFVDELITVSGYGTYTCNYLPDYACATLGKCSHSKRGEISVTTTRVDALGRPFGSYTVDYAGTNSFKNDRFDNIPDKDMHIHNAFPLYEVKSADECGERAIVHDKWAAVYRPDTMTCQLKNTYNDGRTLNRWGGLLGSYNVPFNDTPDSPTYNTTHMDEWIRTKKCDLMHIGADGKLWCKIYENAPGAMLMFRYRT